MLLLAEAHPAGHSAKGAAHNWRYEHGYGT
jgi:hypothetical protein